MTGIIEAKHGAPSSQNHRIILVKGGRDYMGPPRIYQNLNNPLTTGPLTSSLSDWVQLDTDVLLRRELAGARLTPGLRVPMAMGDWEGAPNT